MKYIYSCKKCGIFDNEEKAFDPRAIIKCSCGKEAKKVFIPNSAIQNKMSHRTVII